MTVVTLHSSGAEQKRVETCLVTPVVLYGVVSPVAVRVRTARASSSSARFLASSSLLLSSLELSVMQDYEPCIRALLETASHFCKVVALKMVALNLSSRVRFEGFWVQGLEVRGVGAWLRVWGVGSRTARGARLSVRLFSCFGLRVSGLRFRGWGLR